jgi:hypothetical protein
VSWLHTNGGGGARSSRQHARVARESEHTQRPQEVPGVSFRAFQLIKLNVCECQ